MSRLMSISARPLNPRGALQLSVLLTLSFLLFACSEGTSPPPPAVVAQVIVEPGNHDVKVGEQFTFSARILDANGHEIENRQASWSSTNQDVATVSSDGVVTALAAGTASIRATAGDKSGQATLTVSLQPVAFVELNLGQVSLVVGDSRTLVATAKDAAGRVITDREVTWVSSAPNVVTVDAIGRLTALNIGISMVTASVEGRTATAQVTVSPAPVASIAISQASLLLEIGEQRQLSATVRDAHGNVLTGRAVQWAVDNAVLSITQTGFITGVRQGYVAITATSEGVSTSVGGTVTTTEPYDYDLVYYWTNGTGSELFTLDLANGGAPVRLNAGNVSRSPTASPNGQRVAFAVSMQELTTGEWIHDIYAVDRNGMNMKRLTNALGYDEWPEWSPIGGKIAYQRLALGGRSDIWVMNEDGTNPVSLTTDMPDGAFRSHPSWSRDGQRIAFQQSETIPTGTMASIWIMNADGSNKRQLTSTLTGFDAAPTWSHDGARIAFSRYYAPGDEDITIINVSTGELSRIHLDGLEMNPAWSPDGQLIAFTRNSGVYTMAPNGTRVRLRTVDPSWGGGIAPTWITR